MLWLIFEHPEKANVRKDIFYPRVEVLMKGFQMVGASNLNPLDLKFWF